MAGSSSCQPLYDLGNGQIFVLKNDQSSEYLSAIDNSSVKQIPSSPSDYRLWFTYDNITLQIKSSYNGLCLDDLGHAYSSLKSTSDTLAFTPCSYSITQQFVYQPDTNWIINPNNPYDKCLDGNAQFPSIYLWYCPDGNTNHQWNITVICPPGTVIMQVFGVAHDTFVGTYKDNADGSNCSPCPAGTYNPTVNAIGSCFSCPTGTICPTGSSQVLSCNQL